MQNNDANEISVFANIHWLEFIKSKLKLLNQELAGHILHSRKV